MRITFELELLSGRRAGLVTAGMGAWLVMGACLSKTSSRKM